MEEQKIFPPRFVLKKGTTGSGGYGWEIGSSSSKDKEELKAIVEMVSEINKGVEKKFKKKTNERGQQ